VVASSLTALPWCCFHRRFGVGLGTIFNIMLLGIVIQVVFAVVSGFTNQKKKASLDDEDW
jgi:hypothetical protein